MKIDETKIILQGIVGSTAYGLSTPESDIDRLGVFVTPTTEILSIRKPKETRAYNNPDKTFHEVAKFVRLALKTNPTILELLFLDDYEIATEEGMLLLANRESFLSNLAFKTYGGYALAQAKKLQKRGDSFSSETKNRYAKHARHCFRLLRSGAELLSTGTLDVKVKNPEEIFAIGELPPVEVIRKFEEEFEKFDKIKSVLPDKPDYKRVNEALLMIREANYNV